MTYKTTNKQFEMFKTEVQKWIDVFGLLDWKVRFTHSDEEPSAGGWVSADWANGTAMICLTKTWPHKPKDAEVLNTARHEALELMMWPMFDVAISRYTTREHVEVARHKVIRTLENFLSGLTSE